MSDVAGLRRLAAALPEVVLASDPDDPGAEVGGTSLCWAYLARDQPRARRTVQPGVAAIRSSIEHKEMLLAAAPHRFFDDDHYRGYGAVLVELSQTDDAELAGLLLAAWRLSAPATVRKRHPDVACR